MAGGERTLSRSARLPFRQIVTATVLLACAAVLIAFRLHAYDLPLENDECNYAYTGARLLAGDRLYVDVWDHQPPGVFWLFAVWMALFGDTPGSVRLLAMVFSLTSLVLIMVITRRLSGPVAAIGAGVVFALVSSDPGTAGEGANREIYMNALILAAWYLTVIDHPRGGWQTLAAGMALGLASLIKTVAAAHWLFLAIWLISRAGWMRGPSSTWTTAARSALVFGAGPLVLWMAVLGGFGVTGRLEEFVDAVFVFNLGYGGGGSMLERFVWFFRPPGQPDIFASAAPLWLLSAPAVAICGIQAYRARDCAPASVVAVFVGSVTAVILPGRFWPHYYYLLIPPAIVATAVAFSAVASAVIVGRFPSRNDEHQCAGLTPRPRLVTGLLLGGFVLSVGYFAYRHYLSRPPSELTAARYHGRDFWARAQGANVREATEPADEVFSFGNDAGIYYYSDRRCASRFTMIRGLESGMPGAEQRRETLLAELRHDPPRLILLLFDQEPWPEWRSFLRTYYDEPVGADYHDLSGDPIMLVLPRRDASIPPIDWAWDRSMINHESG